MRLIDADAFIERNKNIIDCEIDHPCFQDTIRELIEESPTVNEPIDPIYVTNQWTHSRVSYCGKCRKPINKTIVGIPYENTKFCAFCGQAVKWK